MTERPEVVTFSEFARIANVKASYVTSLRQAGRLVLTDDGKKVRVAESLDRIEATRDPARAHVAARHAAARAPGVSPSSASEGAAPAGADEAEDVDGEAMASPDTPYSSHRAEREKWQAAMARRDYELSMRELIPIKEVEGAIAKMATVLRKDLEHLPDILAPQIAPLNDEQRIRQVLAESIEGALAEASRQLKRIANGDGSDG
jgi:hypothetical protein